MAWMLAGRLLMLQGAVGSGAADLHWHVSRTIPRGMPGATRGVQENLKCWKGTNMQAGQGVAVRGSKTRKRSIQRREKAKTSLPRLPLWEPSLRSAFDERETAWSLGVVAGCHIRAAPGEPTGATPAATLNSGRGSNVVRLLVQLITSTSSSRLRLDHHHRRSYATKSDQPAQNQT